MKKEPICVVYYSKIEDRNLTGIHLHESQKRLAFEMLKQGFSDFFSVHFEKEKVKRAEGGKPYYLEGDYPFNITHCKEIVAVALANCPVGVDVEQLRLIQRNMAKKSCSEEELKYVLADSNFAAADTDVFADSKNVQKQTAYLNEQQTKRFLEVWTHKESYVKMTGEGLCMPIPTVAFQPITWEKVNNGTCSSRMKYIENFIITVTLQAKFQADEEIISYRKY